MGRSGEVRVLDPKTKTVITTYNIPYGAILMVLGGLLAVSDRRYRKSAASVE